MTKMLILILLFQTVVLGQINQDLEKARKIELLKSTRQDVQKIFGDTKSEIDNFHTERFFTDSSIIDVSYSPGLCKDSDDWNVPEWVAIEVRMVPKDGVDPKKLGLNLSKYKKAPLVHVVGGFIYSDDVKGIKFNFMGEVMNLTLYPSSKYNHLKCEEK